MLNIHTWNYLPDAKEYLILNKIICVWKEYFKKTHLTVYKEKRALTKIKLLTNYLLTNHIYIKKEDFVLNKDDTQ